MRFGISTVLAVLVVLLMGRGPVLADEYVSGEVINGPGGYEFTLKDYGKMRMTQALVDDKPSSSCRVSVQSVMKQIEVGLREKTLEHTVTNSDTVDAKITLLKTTCGDGELCCDGPGKGCKIKVKIESEAARAVLGALGS